MKFESITGWTGLVYVDIFDSWWRDRTNFGSEAKDGYFGLYRLFETLKKGCLEVSGQFVDDYLYFSSNELRDLQPFDILQQKKFIKTNINKD